MPLIEYFSANDSVDITNNDVSTKRIRFPWNLTDYSWLSGVAELVSSVAPEISRGFFLAHKATIRPIIGERNKQMKKMATGPGFLSFAMNGIAIQAAIQKINAAGFIM